MDEPLTLQDIFFRGRRYGSHMGRYLGCKEDVADSIKIFKELEGLLATAYRCPGEASIGELGRAFVLDGLAFMDYVMHSFFLASTDSYAISRVGFDDLV
ncbi:hypothetical protein AVEN_90957-1 [Araneus ventricosus]|uniref:Uncharacterized protein n=1 Tax=Araneus ventricosus TaxID=182803 RepID=A0A4Y2GW87_ARAVE|nr:hypothetical protein AVEN_90957-1 [Araneus ventricosus]